MFLTDASAIDMVTVSGRRVLFSVLTHIFVLDHISDLTSSTLSFTVRDYTDSRVISHCRLVLQNGFSPRMAAFSLGCEGLPFTEVIISPGVAAVWSSDRFVLFSVPARSTANANAYL